MGKCPGGPSSIGARTSNSECRRKIRMEAPSIITLQFVEALQDAAEIEAAIGDQRNANTYREAARRAAEAVRKLCWSEQYRLVADTPSHQHYSQHANILAAWLDVVPKEQDKELLEKILSTTDTGFHTNAPLPPMTAATYYFRFYLARALLHAGMGDRYLELLEPGAKCCLWV